MKIDIRTVEVTETDTCPTHGGDCRREYRFGDHDATTFSFHGCKCVIVVTHTLSGDNNAVLCRT